MAGVEMENDEYCREETTQIRTRNGKRWKLKDDHHNQQVRRSGQSSTIMIKGDREKERKEKESMVQSSKIRKTPSNHLVSHERIGK